MSFYLKFKRGKCSFSPNVSRQSIPQFCPVKTERPVVFGGPCTRHSNKIFIPSVIVVDIT